MSKPSLALVKQEHQSPSPPPQPLDIALGPQFLNSIEQLGNLAAAITAFNTRFDELQKHLDFIKVAIDGFSSDETPLHQIEAETTLAAPSTTVAPDGQMETATTAKPEVLNLCESMCGKGLRRYIISNLSTVAKLREEVPPAIKCSPNPAKLVLDCIGRFFLQGKKAYTKDSPMISGREASVLVLELFLLSLDNEVQMEAAVKQEAEQAAISWRKRLVLEGGLSMASEIDARGLLLLIACYGIPKLFKNDDIWNLVRVSNSRQISEALRRSPVLVARVSDIMEGMMKNGMKLEAVDIASVFGIDDKFSPQKLLTSFLRDSKESLKRRRRDANNSPILLKEANERHLAALKSVMKFLEDRKLDSAKILPGWQFKEKIAATEKDIAALNKKVEDKIISKRKADEEFSHNLRNQEIKRSRITANGTQLISSPFEQRLINHLDSKSTYNGSRINFLDDGFSGHVNNYAAAASVLYGSGAVSLPENVLGTTSVVGGAAASRVGLTTVYGGASTSSYAGHVEMPIDRPGHMGNSGSTYGAGDPPLNERTLNQSYARQPLAGTFLVSQSIDGFAGLPNSSPTAAGVRSSAPDLYRFADTVVESEYSSANHQATVLPPVGGSHYSAYLQLNK